MTDYDELRRRKSVVLQDKVYQYKQVLHDIAAASNHKELCAAILKNKEVLAEVWDV